MAREPMFDRLLEQLKCCMNAGLDCMVCPISEDCDGGIEMLQNSVKALQELKRKNSMLLDCIYQALDGLDRGVDNDFARKALEQAEKV